MATLLNAVTTSETITEYDRSHAGCYDNPYGGVPSLTFSMQRVGVRNSDQKVLYVLDRPSAVEMYIPGKVYDLFNPQTGEKIEGRQFTSDQFFAMLYSIMNAAVSGT